MPALDEAEATRAPRDLRELPRQEVTPFLAVELRRLREEERLAREVHAVAEHVGRDADVGGAREEAVDLLAPRGERHRAVEHGDATGMEPVHLTCEREHRATAEGDDDRARRERAKRALADELERELALEDLQLVPGERAVDERERVEGAEEQDLAVLAGEQQPRPGRAALRVVGPLHLVEDEELASLGRHLDGRADHGRVLVDPLLARDEADVLGADPLAEPAVRLLREHPQRPGVDAGALLGQLLQGGVRLPGVRRAEVRDDTLGRRVARRQRDRDALLRRLHRVRRPAASAIGAARPLLAARVLADGCSCEGLRP